MGSVDGQQGRKGDRQVWNGITGRRRNTLLSEGDDAFGSGPVRDTSDCMCGFRQEDGFAAGASSLMLLRALGIELECKVPSTCTTVLPGTTH